MDQETKSMFEACILDLDYFIDRFRKKAQTPDGERFKAPLDRLRELKKRIKKLTSATDTPKPHDVSTPAVPTLEKLEADLMGELGQLREEIVRLAKSTDKVKPTLTRVEELHVQLLSLASSSIEAATRIQSVLHELRLRAPGAALASTVTPLPIETQAALAAVHQRLAAVQRAVSWLTEQAPALQADLRSEGEQTRLRVGEVNTNLERRISMHEVKLELILAKTDAGARSVQDVLVPRSQLNEETVRKLLAGQQEIIDRLPAGGPAGAPADTAQLSAIEQRLDRVLGRQDALDSLSMVLHPLSASVQSATASLAADRELGDKIDGLARRFDSFMAGAASTPAAPAISALAANKAESLEVSSVKLEAEKDPVGP